MEALYQHNINVWTVPAFVFSVRLDTLPIFINVI